MGKINISSRRGHRRAGEEFSKEGQDYDADHFSKEQMEQLRADPDIVIIEGGAKKSAGDNKALATANERIAELEQDLNSAQEAAKAVVAEAKTAADEAEEALSTETDRADKAEAALEVANTTIKELEAKQPKAKK